MALRWTPLFDGPVGGLGSANKFRAIEAVGSDIYAGGQGCLPALTVDLAN